MLFSTDRCELVSVDGYSIQDIATVFDENKNTLKLLDYNSANNEALSFIKNEDFPPNGNQENSKRLVISSKKHSSVIGILNFYIGYPNITSIYIGDIFIRPQFHNQGLATEVLKSLEQFFLQKGIQEIYVNLGLKNWKAINFWINRGYDKLTRFSGEKNYSEKSFASIECKKLLTRP